MTRRDLLALTPALIVSGCASAPEVKVEKKPAEPVTGLHALYQMYSHARGWAPDIKILQYGSIEITQVKPQPGKVGAWQVTFASEALSQKRAYTFSVYDVSPTLRQGMFPDSAGSWRDDNRSFPIGAVKIDTDVAWATALKHAAEYSAKNPAMPISYTLELSRRVNSPMWRVIWGHDAASSKFSVLVDASTGSYVETLY
ncbi:MAG: hypothetical protein ABJC09_04080 [Terriglobia bacterium]